MAINKKLIHFKKKEKFIEELANGNILDTSIVFILDTKEIYTHGQYYGDLSGTYSKPSTGIPKTDLDSTVQTSLENADLYTAADVKAKLLTVDGSGSKIDADLLDGVELQNILERKYSGGQYQRGAGWKRIAETLDNDSVGSCFRLFLYTSYNDAANEAYIFDISIAYNGTICIEQHAGTAKPASVTRVIDKIRIDYRPGQIAYIDVHHSVEGGNGLWWTTEGAAKSYKTVQEAELLGTAYEFTTTSGCKTDRGFYGSFHGNADSATKATQDGSGNVITTTYATKTELNEKVDKVSGKGLSTNDYTTEEKNKLAGAYTKPSEGIPKTDLASAVQTSLGKADTALQSFTETDPVFTASPAASITNEKIDEWNDKVDKSMLAKVATSGSYDDLTNKPTIPSAVTESAVSGWGFTKNTGTITGINMNGASKGTSGVVDLGTVITSHLDISGKQDKNIYFTNVSASSWVSDSTYSDFPYRCDIACSGVTASMYAEVVFSAADSLSGNYATVCESKAGLVSIWSKVSKTIAIQTIKISK